MVDRPAGLELLELEPESLRHRVERGRQLPELVLALHLDSRTQVLRRDSSGAFGELAKRLHRPPDHDMGQQEDRGETDEDRDQQVVGEGIDDVVDRRERLAHGYRPRIGVEGRPQVDLPSRGEVAAIGAVDLELPAGSLSDPPGGDGDRE